MTDPFWTDPRRIEFKITPFKDLHGVRSDDWDIDRRVRFEDTAKFRAIWARFVEGADWLETALFTDAYKRRLEIDGRIGRCRSLTDLAQDYERRFGKLHAAMKRDGFRTEGGSGKRFQLPALLIGRDGDVFIGNQGNHRLALARVLGLTQFAGKIVCRHQNWTG